MRSLTKPPSIRGKPSSRKPNPKSLRPNNRAFLLKPLPPVQNRSLPKILTFDIEANGWTKFEMGGIYDGSHYVQLDSMEELFDSLLCHSKRGAWIYSHFGGKYDLLFVLQYWLEHARKGFHYEAVLQGSKIIKLTFKKDGHRWYFLDSSALFSGLSLARIADSFGGTRKQSGAIDFEGGERVDRRNSKHREYLRADCVALFEALENFLGHEEVKRVRTPITLASLALNLWRTTLRAPLRVTPDEIQAFVRRSYFGGRVEIFRMKGERLNVYDVNSLFPFVMRDRPMPCEWVGAVEDFDPETPGFYEVTLSIPEMPVPPLPHLWEASKKLLFPCGTFRGVWYGAELNEALKRGARIQKFHRGEAFETSTDLFREHVDKFFAMKARAAKGSGEELIAKLILNSCYGKFGQREEKEILKTHEGEEAYYCGLDPDQDEKWGLIQIRKRRRAAYMLCHIAAAVTAHARLELLSWLDADSLYCDTDSIFTQKRLPTSVELGGLKREHEFVSGVFLAPKAYQLADEFGAVLTTKLKGFSKKFANSLKPEIFVQGKFLEEREHVLSLKQALMREDCFLSLGKSSRRFLSNYDKRRVLPDGSTQPWILAGDKILNLPRK